VPSQRDIVASVQHSRGRILRVIVDAMALAPRDSPRTNRVPAPSYRRSIRILLVDDEVAFRRGLRALLEKQRGLVVVGEAGTGAEGVNWAAATRPDVVLMDLSMPEEGGIAATRRIVALGTGTKVLIISGLLREEQLLDALEAGALGYVEKTSPIDDVVRAIRTVIGGAQFLGTDAARIVVTRRPERRGPPAAGARLEPAQRRGSCSVRQCSEPSPHTRSTACIPTTGRSETSARMPNASRSFGSLNVGTSTAALAM
jgi:DNA-binding NarL/FixJ family response regulator